MFSCICTLSGWPVGRARASLSGPRNDHYLAGKNSESRSRLRSPAAATGPTGRHALTHQPRTVINRACVSFPMPGRAWERRRSRQGRSRAGARGPRAHGTPPASQVPPTLKWARVLGRWSPSLLRPSSTATLCHRLSDDPTPPPRCPVSPGGPRLPESCASSHAKGSESVIWPEPLALQRQLLLGTPPVAGQAAPKAWGQPAWPWQLKLGQTLVL